MKSKKVTGDEVVKILEKKYKNDLKNSTKQPLPNAAPPQQPKLSREASKLQFTLEYVRIRAGIVGKRFDPMKEAKAGQEVWEFCAAEFEKDIAKVKEKSDSQP